MQIQTTPFTDLDQACDAAVALLKALASPIRLKLLCQLVEGERAVGQIAGLLGVRETLVSQHLALLRRDGLVAFRRDGQTLYYRLEDPAARRLLETLHAIYCAPPGPLPSAIPGIIGSGGGEHGQAGADDTGAAQLRRGEGA